MLTESVIWVNCGDRSTRSSVPGASQSSACQVTWDGPTITRNVSTKQSGDCGDELGSWRPLITGAAELPWYVSGQVSQALAGNTYPGLVCVSDTTVVVGEILHDSLGVVGSGRKNSRSIILTLYRNERSAHPREPLAVQAKG